MTHEQNIKISQSELHGQGLIANRPIMPGQTIMHIRGKILKLPAFFKLPQKIKDNTYYFSATEYLDPRNEYGVFLNHSCDPNAKIVKNGRRLYLVSIMEIKKDQEITIDYSTIIAKDDYWIMNCQCGANQCRKKIKRYNTLPPDILKDYLNRDLIPSYILAVK